ncbi:MAG: FtsW/RodA/SpoVE family cell cycle protein, partial [Lachnospiraceae bacterium]|nr:FtsW/RodA/SpoVE family cell cycle protein [Lachnospiraceae bacterium]
MVHLIIEISKYLIILLFAVYTYECFSVFKKRSLERQNRIFGRQTAIIYMIHLDAMLVIFASTKNIKVIGLYLIQLILLIIIQLCYKTFYQKASKLIVNNMCMLLSVSFIILTRLNFDKALKQCELAGVAIGITLLIPFIIHKLKFFYKLAWIYAGVGLAMLGIVAALGSRSYGAKLSFSFAGISIQPSEFIKIVFVFFVASMFYESTEFRQVVKATVVAALHVMILVVSKDLGAALIFFMVYLVMLYVATRKPSYALAGLGSGVLASFVAYKLFNHVRVRVLAWKDPLGVIDKEGYQICQSLFAIGTGGWFGMGLTQGMPKKIPVVEEDFVFAAISEELGGVFALCLMLVCVSCYLMFLNIAMQIKDRFYKLIALGLGTVYGFQVFLTIGGVTKFIPSTGVTLPFVSYGGSSLLSTAIIFAIIQGLYILRQDEEGNRINVEKKSRKKSGKRPKKKER